MLEEMRKIRSGYVDIKIRKRCKVCVGTWGLRKTKNTMTIIRSLSESTLNSRSGSASEEGGKGRNLLEDRVKKMPFEEKVKVFERSFLWKPTYYLRIKWLPITLSAALMRKWHLNSGFTAKQPFLPPSIGV